MGLSERESMRKGTNEPLVSSKEEMIQILEALEQDNLLMYAAEDNQVILMWAYKMTTAALYSTILFTLQYMISL